MLPKQILQLPFLIGPEGWCLLDDVCLKTFQEKIDWYNAERNCRLHGGHLVSINSKAQNEYISSLVSFRTILSYLPREVTPRSRRQLCSVPLRQLNVAHDIHYTFIQNKQTKYNAILHGFFRHQNMCWLQKITAIHNM